MTVAQVSTACPEWGTPALFQAEVLQRCLAAGLNPNAKMDKVPLLIIVAGMSGQEATEAVQVLLEAGADVNVQVNDRRRAVGVGRGANPDGRHKRGVRRGTVLMIASSAGHTATVQVLLDAGAAVNAPMTDPKGSVGGFAAQGLTSLILA